MDVHGAGALTHSALARAGQGAPFTHEMRGRSFESKLGDPVLRLQHDISAGLRRVEIEVARTETVMRRFAVRGGLGSGLRFPFAASWDGQQREPAGAGGRILFTVFGGLGFEPGASRAKLHFKARPEDR